MTPTVSVELRTHTITEEVRIFIILGKGENAVEGGMDVATARRFGQTVVDLANGVEPDEIATFKDPDFQMKRKN